MPGAGIWMAAVSTQGYGKWLWVLFLSAFLCGYRGHRIHY